jgi:ubiquinone biosynthesis protein COQ9
VERSKQIDQEKQLILKNFLKNAPFDNWSISNLMKSSEGSGFAAEYALLLFPNGVEDLTKYFHQAMNNEMEEAFINNPYNKAHEKVIHLIELKFALYNKYKEAVCCLVKYNLKPQNILLAKSMLWETCNKIWYLAGDKSTDHNYYTKRGLLAAVYSSSLVYFLNDNSEDYYKTREFIRSRIANVLALGKWKKSGLDFLKKFR